MGFSLFRSLKGARWLSSLPFPFSLRKEPTSADSCWFAGGSQIPQPFVTNPKAPTDTCRKDACYTQSKADSVDNLARSKILANSPISLHKSLNIKYQCSTKLTKEQHHRDISKMLGEKRLQVHLNNYSIPEGDAACTSVSLHIYILSVSCALGELSKQGRRRFI